MHALELHDGLTELPPSLRVRHGRVERPLREPDHLRPDTDAAGVERLDRDLVAGALAAEHLVAPHAHVI